MIAGTEPRMKRQEQTRAIRSGPVRGLTHPSSFRLHPLSRSSSFPSPPKRDVPKREAPPPETPKPEIPHLTAPGPEIPVPGVGEPEIPSRGTPGPEIPTL
jgi:hypothetical protein